MELSKKSLKSCIMLLVLILACLNFVVQASTMRRPIRNSSDCRNRYGYKQYYDIGTLRCEKCEDICVNAEIMWTVDLCQAECKEYLTAKGCEEKEDQYYDEAMRTCAPCSSVCDNYEVTGTLPTCKEHCSAYLEKLIPKQVPSHHKLNHLKASDLEDEESAHALSHPGYISLIAVLGLVAVALVVFAIYAYVHHRRQGQQYNQAPQAENEMQERVVTGEATPTVATDNSSTSSGGRTVMSPVEESSWGASVSRSQMAIGTDSPVPLGLADLHRDGNEPV